MTYEKLFSGQLPTRLVIGLVDNGAFNGNSWTITKVQDGGHISTSGPGLVPF